MRKPECARKSAKLIRLAQLEENTAGHTMQRKVATVRVGQKRKTNLLKHGLGNRLERRASAGDRPCFVGARLGDPLPNTEGALLANGTAPRRFAP